MRLSADARRHLIVAAVFTMTVGIGFAGATWLDSRDVPTPLQDCVTKCASLHRDGQLVYDGPVGARSDYRDAHSVCECQG